MHVLNIVGRPGDQTCHRVFGEKGYCQALDVPEEGHSQIVHYHMACIFHDNLLNEIKTEIEADEN